MAALDDTQVLIATGKYIGDGFDLPRLDTLFLNRGYSVSVNFPYAVDDRPNGATHDRPNGATLMRRFAGLRRVSF
jgi:hypothetical protein